MAAPTDLLNLTGFPLTSPFRLAASLLAEDGRTSVTYLPGAQFPTEAAPTRMCTVAHASTYNVNAPAHENNMPLFPAGVIGVWEADEQNSAHILRQRVSLPSGHEGCFVGLYTSTHSVTNRQTVVCVVYATDRPAIVRFKDKALRAARYDPQTGELRTVTLQDAFAHPTYRELVTASRCRAEEILARTLMMLGLGGTGGAVRVDRTPCATFTHLCAFNTVDTRTRALYTECISAASVRGSKFPLIIGNARTGMTLVGLSETRPQHGHFPMKITPDSTAYLRQLEDDLYDLTESGHAFVAGSCGASHIALTRLQPLQLVDGNTRDWQYCL